MGGAEAVNVLLLLLLLNVAAAAIGPEASGGEPRPVVLAEERLLAVPGPVLRAQSLIGAPSLPSGGLAIAFDCTVTSGKIYLDNCRDSGEAPEWAPFAARRLGGYRVDPAGLRFGRSKRLSARLVVRLAPEDRRDLTLAGPIAADSALLVFEKSAGAAAAASFYPPPARRADIQTGVAVACRVLDDLALFCPEAAMTGDLPERARDRPGIPALFAAAAQQITGMMRVAPALKDGHPAVGYQFRMVVGFRLASE